MSVVDELARHGVVPVIAIESVDAALPLADALIEGGLPVAEITFRTEAAPSVIALLSKERPDLLVGAGTVLTKENAAAAKECGAKFAVAPGFNPNVVKHAQSIGLPFMPGICSPSEIEAALELDCKTLKYFPAEAAGGIPFLTALCAPYAHTGVSFVPTGGVTIDNIGDYLALGAVTAVGGTWIAKKDAIADEEWDAIRKRCEEVVAIVAGMR